MSTSPERRSPTPESMSSVSSAFSFDDNAGTTLNSPNITTQSAPQGIVNWMQGHQTDLLNELETKGAASLADEHSESSEAPQAPVEVYPMHERFCFPAENIYFLVQGVLYSVHRYFFERDSSSFVGQGLSKQEPMVLANVSTHDFDLFLSILYPTTFGVYPASTVEQWSGILYLADKWGFLSIRALAIAQIAPIVSPIDKIVFGRLYGIDEWLTSAYHAVCDRPDALSLEEGRRLGVDDVIRINAIRQEFCFVRVSESSSKLLEGGIKSRFGLAIQTEHSASSKSAKDVANRLKLDNAAEATSKKEEVAGAAEIVRKKREQEAADKKAKDKRAQEQREADAKAADIERKKKEREAADKKVKDLEENKVRRQREAEAQAADIEQKKREQEAADKKVKDLEENNVRRQLEAEAKAADMERKETEAAAKAKRRSLQPGTPTQSPALTHQPPHSNNGSISGIASPPSMPSTPASQNNSTLPGANSANRLSTYANTFVPGPPRSSKISIKAADGSEVDLKAISSKRVSPGLPLSSPSASGFNRAANGHQNRKSQIIRMESEEAAGAQKAAEDAGRVKEEEAIAAVIAAATAAATIRGRRMKSRT